MPTALRILLVRSHAGYYGVERMIVELAAGLQASGHHPHVGIIGGKESADHPFVDACRRHGVEFHLFPSSCATDRETLVTLQKCFKSLKPHVIHSHGYKADLLAWMANRSTRFPLMSTCHPWLGTKDSLRMWLYAQLDKLVLTRFDRVVAVTETVKNECAIGAARRQVRLIANGLDLERDDRPLRDSPWREKWGIRPDAFVIGAVGRLSKEKGHHLLLQAYAEVCRQASRRSMLLLIGDGPERPLLERLTDQLGLMDRVRFLGYQQDIPGVLGCLDLYAMPSLSEGFPLALLEAMAAGRIVLATDVGEIRRILDHGKAGMVVEPGHIQHLAKGLLTLIEQPEQYRGMARYAQELARTRYSRQAMTEQYERVYRSLWNEKELQSHVA